MSFFSEVDNIHFFGKVKREGFIVCDEFVKINIREGRACSKPFFFYAEKRENAEKTGLIFKTLAQINIKVLTFDNILYIRGNEKNSCFICVGVLLDSI